MAIKIGTTDMDNAIAIDNNHLTMNDTARTLSGDHESRVTDTGTSIVQPAVCKTLSAEGFDGMPDIQKGNGQPVIAVRTANTHANGHGVAETHTLDRASGQAVAVGFKAGQSANGGLGIEEEVCPTQSHQPSALEPTVAVGINSPQPHSTTRGFGVNVQPTFGAAAGESGNNKPMVAVGVDAYNQATTGCASKPLGHSATDTDHTPAVVLNHIVRRLTPVECSRLQGFPDYWCRIPMGKWRKIDRGEYEYLASHGDWHRSHIRETGKPGVWETDLSSDSPAYKALGNSWATNCAEWILRRIVAAFRLDLVPEAAE